MRISDWSSDVCSSDLSRSNSRVVQNRWNNQRRWDRDWRNDRRYDWRDYRNSHRRIYRMPRYYAPRGWHNSYSRYSVGIYLNDLLFARNYWIDDPYYYRLPPAYGSMRWIRSEEHTSELQSLMRISYAVFCLKKKNNQTQQY